MRVPPELDDMMWRLAESSDEKGHAEFLIRYPDYKSEFEKRIAMVNGLKGSRPKASRARPDFMPSARSLASASGPPRLALVGAAALVLAGTVFATLGTVRYLDSRRPVATTATAPDNHQQQPITTGGGQPEGGQLPVANNHDPKRDLPEIVAPVSPFDSLVTVVATKLRLSNCLDDVARQAGIRLESAPGMEALDMDIEVDYRGVPAAAVLEDLARNFKFTILRQSADTALLVPAVDPKKPLESGTAGTSGPSGPPTTGGDSGLSPVGDSAGKVVDR